MREKLQKLNFLKEINIARLLLFFVSKSKQMKENENKYEIMENIEMKLKLENNVQMMHENKHTHTT